MFWTCWTLLSILIPTTLARYWMALTDKASGGSMYIKISKIRFVCFAHHTFLTPVFRVNLCHRLLCLTDRIQSAYCTEFIQRYLPTLRGSPAIGQLAISLPEGYSRYKNTSCTNINNECKG